MVRRYMRLPPNPLTLSLSKGCPSSSPWDKKGQGFDRLSPNGQGELSTFVILCFDAHQKFGLGRFAKRITAKHY